MSKVQPLDQFVNTSRKKEILIKVSITRAIINVSQQNAQDVQNTLASQKVKTPDSHKKQHPSKNVCLI